MRLALHRAEGDRLQDLDRCDGSFVVRQRLCLTLEAGVIGYAVQDVDPYPKRYPDDTGARDDEERTVYLAYADGRVCGQLELSEHWNGYASIDALTVDAAHRRRGVGRALVAQAVAWSRDQRLAGVRLETQDVNVAACRLYARCGFVLHGFDQALYRGLSLSRPETALYWYWHADGATDGIVSP